MTTNQLELQSIVHPTNAYVKDRRFVDQCKYNRNGEIALAIGAGIFCFVVPSTILTGVAGILIPIFAYGAYNDNKLANE